MGARRSLTRRIVPAAVELALVQARRPERLAKYMHRFERERGLVVQLGYRIAREVLSSKAIRES